MESETLRAETGTTKEVANGMLKKMRKIFFLPLGELGRDVSIALLLESKALPNLLLENHNVITLMNSVGWKLGGAQTGGSAGKTQPDGVTQQQVASKVWWRVQPQLGLVTTASITASPCGLGFFTLGWPRGSWTSYMSAKVTESKRPSGRGRSRIACHDLGSEIT